MVTDNDLKRLGFIRKANPHKAQWADMMLFLKSQVGNNWAHTAHQHLQIMLMSKQRSAMSSKFARKDMHSPSCFGQGMLHPRVVA